MKAPPPLERHIHLGIARFLALQAAPGVVWWHTANERKTSPRQGAILKKMGVKAGVPDFVLLLPSRLSAFVTQVAFIEVKRPGCRLTRAQIDFSEKAFDLGCSFGTAHSVDEAIAFLELWGALKKRRIS